MTALVLFSTAFFACAVEMVEALTIVLAVGVTRGWRSALRGSAVALAALTIVVALLGPAIAHVPIGSLRLVVGALLLIFGLQWLRKAILRASGITARHDERAAYDAEVAELRAAGGAGAHDWYAFTVAFKGVFLEGLEVAFIVVTFGGSQHNVGLASLAAATALVIVLIAGAVAHAPLSRVPENALKFGVGVMLSAFGTFWMSEGAGVSWPGADVAILALIVFMLVVSYGLVTVGRRRVPAADTGRALP